jgi:sRNA-binding regulator protein Hfq
MTEDSFLNERIRDQKPIFCWLSNGIRIQGIIQANDLEAIFVLTLRKKIDVRTPAF